MHVSVIIINYNTTEHLVNCLDSIIRFTKDVDYEIIVVDNNSSIRDIENLPKKYPAVKYLFRNVNDGFGSGCNFGVRNSDPMAKYVVFVNPDIIFIDNSLYKIYEYMESNSDVGVCSGLFINANEEVLYSYNYDMNIMWELKGSFNIGVEKFKKKLVNRSEVINKMPFEIDWALGAFLFIRKEAFNSVKGFDKDFFLYTEDNDLQYRLRKKGFKIVCIPTVRIVHYYGSSMDDENSKSYYNYYLYKSKMIYIYKHFNLFKRNAIRFILISGLLMRMFKSAFLWKSRRLIFKEQLFPAFLTTLKSYRSQSLII
jgi:hypothetical protein